MKEHYFYINTLDGSYKSLNPFTKENAPKINVVGKLLNKVDVEMINIDTGDHILYSDILKKMPNEKHKD